jgi:hypothetical protein
MYEFITDTVVTQVGLVRISPHKHCSPDALVGDDGMIEIKCVIPKVHVETIITESIDGSYIKQMQWSLHIAARKWCDFISYSPLMVNKPIWIKRVFRDEKLIKELDMEADKFIGEMLNIVKKIKGGD